MSDTKLHAKGSPLFKQKHSLGIIDGEKALSNIKFFQQVVNLKEKYEKLHSNVNRQSLKVEQPNIQKLKESDHLLSLYEKYMAKQNQEPIINNVPSYKSNESQTTHSTQLQQSSSLHQLSHCFQPKINVKTQQTFNNNIHRFSLDNFRSQQAQSTDLRQHINNTHSQSRQGLKSFMSTNINNKSSSISNSFNSKSFKHTSVAKEDQQRYSLKTLDKQKQNIKSFSKEQNIQPSQFMSSYFSSNKYDRSEEQNNLIKYISLGGRSQTIDQIELKEQHTGRESHPSLKQQMDNNREPSRYQHILQNLIYRSNEKTDHRNSSSNNRVMYNKSQSNKAIDNDDQQDRNGLQISTQFYSPKPISQPQSAKNVDSPYHIVAQQSLTSKMARDQSDLKSQSHYFQFPSQQDTNTIQTVKVNKPSSSSSSPIELQSMLNRTQDMLERYRNREIRWLQERDKLILKLKDTTEQYQQSQREVRRLNHLNDN